MSKALYDSNVLIAYLFKEENCFEVAREILSKHESRSFSIITLHEIHYYSIKYGVERDFLKIKDALTKIFRIIPLTQEICITASQLRRKYNLPEVDSIILSSAIEYSNQYFYTFDRDFKQLNLKKIKNTQIHYIGNME